MNRRNFLKSILATGIAPYVITTAGLLMPVRQLIKPPTLITLTGDIRPFAIGDLLLTELSNGESEIMRVIGLDNNKLQLIRAQAYHK